MKFHRSARRFINSFGYYRVSPDNLIELICSQLKYKYSEDTELFNDSGPGRLAFPDLIPCDAVGIELGVAEGYFSDAILASQKVVRLYSVDCWADHHDSAEYIRAVARLSKYGTRSVVMRSFFDDALPLFSDGFFDFIYIDAYAHTGQQDGDILNKWYPKIKDGGIFSGHDYDSQEWPKTVEVVDRFARATGNTILLLPGVNSCNPEDKYPSWYFVK
ncbi:class I SAM-dependent methyltransferase [Thiocystis violascens]|uniref:Methyltransferase family protein n=1 Tax=Thiocystis violascens (strain ATCC 17096 / DSM 198 / 6111) TaxID=765911 RepID=I3Y5D4_THIV6|nr:class I SAM-dependent methyltransferase [Thiocystis violascens]AFL72202.1 hypothetical protein Thivi_0126 [Thiocystis violascens DSM 198]